MTSVMKVEGSENGDSGERGDDVVDDEGERRRGLDSEKAYIGRRSYPGVMVCSDTVKIQLSLRKVVCRVPNL